MNTQVIVKAGNEARIDVVNCVNTEDFDRAIVRGQELSKAFSRNVPINDLPNIKIYQNGKLEYYELCLGADRL